MSIVFTTQAQYSNVKLGDILDINGTKGIVFMVDNIGEHGSIMSIDIFRGVGDPWGTKKSHVNNLVMNNKNDGMKNTQEVFEYIEKNNLDLNTFPAFAWCKKLGDGWYIPSIGQLEIFINYWLGNNIVLEWDFEDEGEYQLDEKSDSQQKVVNKLLLEAGGYPFLNGLYSSTKSDKGKVYTFYYNNIKQYWKFYKRGYVGLGERSCGRAFYDF